MAGMDIYSRMCLSREFLFIVSPDSNNPINCPFEIAMKGACCGKLSLKALFFLLLHRHGYCLRLARRRERNGYSLRAVPDLIVC